MERLHFDRDDVTARLGRPMHRIPIDLKLGCPNRENGGRGCLFCAENGARARHLPETADLQEQVVRGVAYVQERYHALPPYAAYFQAFTNTFASVETLRFLYDTVFGQADFQRMIVATRPDALPDDVLDLLVSYQDRYEVWVELGVQTACDRTLETVQRGHTFADSVSAVKRLHARGIKVAAHVILGLPDETDSDFCSTAHALAELPIDAIKLHQMLIFKRTPLAAMFRADKTRFALRNEYDYARAVKSFLKILPDSVAIMRLNADADPAECVPESTQWTMKKGAFLHYFQRYWADEHAFGVVETEDHSFSAYHPRYKQHFHALSGAESETRVRFIEGTDFEDRVRRHVPVRVLDIGFGLGYNAFAALEHAAALSGKTNVTSLESDASVLAIAGGIYAPDSVRGQWLKTVRESRAVETAGGTLELVLADARTHIRTLAQSGGTMFDCIFLDPFSPDVNPELWSYDFLKRLKVLLAPDGVISTYSAAFPVIGAALRAGFSVSVGPAFARKKPGLLLRHLPGAADIPLREKDRNIARKSLAGVPFRDPLLCADAESMRRRRTSLVERLRRAGIPKWYK